MAPSQSRQLLIWTIPTIAVILSYFWYKRKRIESKADPGDAAQKITADATVETPLKTISCGTSTATPRTFSRSLSGVESAPIDIVLPPKLRATKSNSTVIPDEDLDLEIEKIKSMRYGGSIDLRKSNICSEPTANESESIKKSPPQPTTVMTQTVSEEKIMPFASIQSVKQEKSPAANNEAQRQNSERDSANHSPADVMLVSPSLSSISDNHSEGSNDSGKGGSEVITPPPSRSLGAESTNIVPFTTLYEFIIPQHLVGKLIGKHGSSVANIRDKTGAHVVVRKHPTNSKLKVCSIEGSQKEIDSALKLIRDKFPLKRFPDVTLEQVTFIPQMSTVPLIPDHLYLKLIEGINNDTSVSCIVAPNHLFFQQPEHPTFPNLDILRLNMNAWYSEVESPFLPTPVAENTICVAYSDSNWYRAVVLSSDESNDTCFIKFLDYGGYTNIEYAKLRQITVDFLSLPFQASECFLANIKPIGESGWREEAYKTVAEITKNAMIFTQIADYTQEGVPLVYCYVYVGAGGIVFLNEELVKLGYAEWLQHAEDEAAGVTRA